MGIAIRSQKSTKGKGPDPSWIGAFIGSGGRDRTDQKPLENQAFESLLARILTLGADSSLECENPDLRLFARVVHKWPTLNKSLKLAVLAIVDSTNE